MVFNPEPASDIIQLVELDTMCPDYSVWPVEQRYIIYQLQFSSLCWNENRAAVIMYYPMSIPSGIDLDLCSTHPAISEIEKTILM